MARLSMAEKEKRTPKFLRKIFESPKKKAERLSTKSGKANTAASAKMKAAETSFRDAKASIRDKAKTITGKQLTLALKGRLGVVIDGTGKDYKKVKKSSDALRKIGYDTYMIFVNTSLDVALERNAKRSRSVPESVVIKSWKAVQANIGKFNNHFKQNLIIVDNNEADEDIIKQVYKRIQGLLKKKVKNTRAKSWIEMELARKKR